jgi:flagellar basal body rod protein FlgC
MLKETGYGLAVQAEKMELMTENFANYVTTARSSQALALAAALEDKIDITNQYLQLAKKFNDVMAKMKVPKPTTNPLRATTQHNHKPSVDHGSYC